MSRKKTHEEFMEQISDRLTEYDVLSRYTSATGKIKFRHKKCGSIFEMKPNHFISGQGCRVCSYKKRKDNLMKGKREFLASLPSRYKGWKFTGYTKVGAPVVAECPNCGRKHTYAKAKSFIQGHAGCRYCDSSRKMPDEIMREEVKRECHTLVERLPSRLTRTGAYRVQQIKVRCNICGKERITSLSNLRKYGCPVCSGHSGRSKEEDEVFEWVKQYAPSATQGDKNVLSHLGKRGQELDIYIPDANVAIEYNGRRFHGTPKKPISGFGSKPKGYHYQKSVECEKAGIRLIHIWDYEWQDPTKQRVLKNIILGALNKLPERYYARECEVCRYDQNSERWNELNRFFEHNNIQGNRGGSLVYTLEKDGEILMAYKFGRPSGGNAKKKYQYEMVRGACKLGVQVVGGATRLWRHFVNDVKPISVVYYVDYNYFDGRSVEKLGGRYLGSQQGVKNYWIKQDKVKNREPARHKEVKEAIERGDVIEIWTPGVKTYVFVFQ